MKADPLADALTDLYRRELFESRTQVSKQLSDIELLRASQTAALVPREWRTVLDVGAGDGRVSAMLLQRGHAIIGLDWAVGPLRDFPGHRVVCDLRARWPLRTRVDGAICCEVLEHLTDKEAESVIDQLSAFTMKGFLVTVPANEDLRLLTVTCPNCSSPYHIYGHVRSFPDYRAIDRLVGRKGTLNRHVVAGRRASWWLARLQRGLGFPPWAPGSICPRCGQLLPPPTASRKARRLLNKALAALQVWGSFCRQPGGWYAVLYLHHST